MTSEREAFITELRKLYESNARRYGLNRKQREAYVTEQIARRLSEWEKRNA